MSLLNPSDYTVAWIAVLHIEAEAALHMLDRLHEGRFPMQRGNDYVFLAGDLGGHNIVIATLPEGREYGTSAAAVLATKGNRNPRRTRHPAQHATWDDFASASFLAATIPDHLPALKSLFILYPLDSVQKILIMIYKIRTIYRF